MIDVKGLTRYYGEKRAISDVTFHVNKGEVLGLLGPNAAGKTTTMRILTCYMPPTSGSATVGGYDIFEQSLEVRRITGYLPENPPLYTDMTVDDYLTFVAKIKGVPRDRLKKEVDAVVEKASIGDVRKRIIGKLSKGYKQRVGLAQSLINNPQIVILDEPTVGLDPKQIIEIRQLIKNLGGDHTVILSSHILPEIEQTCERVVIINEGKVVVEDTVENLTNRMHGVQRITLQVEGTEEAIKQALQPISDIQKLEFNSKGKDIREVIVETPNDVRKELAKAIVNSGLGLLELSTERFTLEEIFLHLTTKEEVA
ncbi:ABC transporter ATP-binding protein [Caldithrix abyssi]|uniref:ABC transporter related protein n=1 Tax=Caldithrix abyssi DSM 13497 TaxID=880073 RepID=H1XZ09_CALAY|nr:ATP-binding cassette domain-containing protein [Caldithrix abyssi]APF18033.1 ABC-2 type transport system ATP-binding protein [Caldithrix abyssi DSM 13497]EHO42080.1 ABC transporter related protein [Caldithrix abyssi DSM 13497]